MKTALFGAAMLCLFFIPNVYATNNNNIPICHYLGHGGYQRISVNDDAIDGDGNGDHNRSSHQDGKDIIPPGHWDSNGRNWDTQGQEIYRNNCNTATPTPVATTQPTRKPYEPTTVPTTVPSTYPTATASAMPTVEPGASGRPDPTDPGNSDDTSRGTNLSDGRSDGKVDPNSCTVRDCSGNRIPTKEEVLAARTLPSTGDSSLWVNLAIGFFGICLGYRIRKFVDGNNI